MKTLLIILIFIITSGVSFAQYEIKTDSLKNFYFINTLGFKKDNVNPFNNVWYSILAKGLFIIPRISSDSLLDEWFVQHKNALVKPVSSMVLYSNSLNSTNKTIYSWIIDDEDTLNIFLIRNGVIPAGTLLNFNDTSEGTNVFYNSEREGYDFINYITNDEYNIFITKIKDAEKYAYDNRLGIWDDDETRRIYSPHKNVLLHNQLYNNVLPITEFTTSLSLRRAVLFDFKMYNLISDNFIGNPEGKSDTLELFVNDWVTNHPDANVKIISRFASLNYIWAYSKTDTLNIELVQNGLMSKEHMIHHKELGNLMLNDSAINIIAEYSKMSVDSTKILLKRYIDNIILYITDEEYEIFKQKLEAAENYAKQNKLGIWRKKEDEEKNE